MTQEMLQAMKDSVMHSISIGMLAMAGVVFVVVLLLMLRERAQADKY